MKPKTLFYSSLIAAAAMSTVPVFADTTGSTDSIWINFYSGKGTGATGYTGTWNDTGDSATGTAVSLNYSDGTASDASLTYSSPNTYEYTSGITDGVLKGYLDDGSSGSGVSVSVSNISYLVYDVTVLVATDTENATFSAKTLNGQTYTSDGNGNGVLGSTTWGASRQASINNKNSFTVSGLSGDLSLSSAIKNGTVRGCVAGLIITNSGGTAVNATISDDSATWTSDSLAGETWKNATTDSRYLANITLGSSVALNVTGTDITTTAIIASGDSKTLTLSGNAVNLIGPGVVRTDSTTANIVINNTLNFANGGKISGNVSTGESGKLSVSDGAFYVSASESENSSLNVSVGEGVSLGILSGTVNITEGTSTISTLTQTGGTLKFSESATATITTANVSGGTVSGATITTANLTGGALSGGNITTANVTSGTVAISGSTIGALNATGGTVKFSGEGTKTTISEKISVCGGATVEQSAGTVSATRLVLNDSSAKTASFYTLSGGVLNISGDGKQATSETSDNAILIGHWNSGNKNSDASILTVSGGVLNATSGITTVSWDSAGTLEVSDGEANLYGISLNRYRNYGPATFTLSGGRVNLGAGGLTYGNGTVAITSKTATLSGGTLGALEDWSSSVAISVAGDVAIDTTKMSANTDGKATTTSTGATITLSGNITQTAGTLTVSGAGTLALSGTSTLKGSVTVDSGATLDLSGAMVSLTSAISNSATVTVDSSTVFVLNDSLKSGNVYTLISGSGSITDWNTLTISNFRQADGTAFSGRSEVDVSTAGVAKITGVAFNLFWNGGTAGTWNTTEGNTIWGKDSASGTATAFVTGDNVTFDSGETVAVTIDSDGVTARTMTVSAGTVTLSGGNVTANAANITAGTLSISSGTKLTTNNGITVSGTGTLKISSNSNIGGSVTVGKGGTFDLNGQSGDVMLNTGFSTLTLAGGKLVNNGSSVDTGMQQLYALTVTADSEVGGTGDFGIINKGHNATALNLGGNKLTKTGSNTFWLVNTTISGNGGTLEATAGTLGGRSENTITLGEGVSLKTSGTAGVSDLSISSMGAGSNLTLAGTTASTVSISGAVGDGASINVSNGNAVTLSGAVGDGASIDVSKGSAVTWTHGADQSTTAAITIGEGSSFKDNSDYKYTLELSGKLSGAGTLISGVATTANQGDGFRSVTLSGSTAGFTGTWELETASSTDTSGNRRINGILNSSDSVFGGVISFTGSSADSSKTSSTLSLAKDMEIGGLKGTLSNTIVQSNNTTARALTINTVDGASYDYAGTIASTISSLTKTGAGTQTLSGTLSTTNMTVSEGMLNISGSATISGTFSGSGTLNVNDGGVLEMVGANGDNGNDTNQTAGTINVKGGGTLNFSGHDLMGWGGTNVNTAVVLAGASEEKVARLNINDSASLTLSRNITMNGNALISTTSSSSFNTLTGVQNVDVKITATGTNNKISDVGVQIRDNFEIEVTNDSDVLEIASPISNNTYGAGGITKTGAGTLILSGNNSGLSTGQASGGVTPRRTITVSAGTVVAKTSSALGSTATTVNEGGVLKVSVDGGVNVGDGSVTFNENAKFAIDLTAYSDVKADKALTIITASAISFNGGNTNTVAVTSEDIDIESYFSVDDSKLGEWAKYARTWSNDNGTLTLTLTIPEPSTFGLLAGVGALALVAARRRRRAK